MSKGEQGSGNNTVVQSELADPRPKSLMMALSEIEQFSYAERTSHIPVEALTSIALMDFSVVGIKYAIKSTIVSALLAPPIMMVEKNLLPVFGDTNTTLFDKFFAYALAISMPMAFALFISYIIQKSLTGDLTRKTIKGVVSGLVIGKLLATFVVWIVFNIVYVSIFTKERIASFIIWFHKKQWKLPWDAESIYYWLVYARESIIDSIPIIMTINVLFVGIILVSVALGKCNDKRYKKFIEEWT